MLFLAFGSMLKEKPLIAEEVVNRVISHLKSKNEIPCITATTPLPGAIVGSERELCRKKSLAAGLSEQQADHLLDTYGLLSSEILAIAARDADGREPLCQHHTEITAELTYAVEQEYLKHLTSWYTLRTKIAYTPCYGRCCLEKTARKMGFLLDWSESRLQQEIEACRLFFS